MPLRDTVLAEYSDAPIYTVTGFSTQTIDASGEKVAFIFQVPKTGVIDRIGFGVRTVTTPQTLRVGLQTLSSGNPSGSAYGSMVAGTQTSPSSNNYYEVALATPANAIRGDFVAIVIEFDSSVGNLQIATADDTPNYLMPNVSLFTASWSKQTQRPVCHIRYSDGSYPSVNSIPASAFASTSFNSGSTPDERGLKFRLPFPCAIGGIHGCFGISSSGVVNVNLYDENGVTLASVAVTSANLTNTGVDNIKIMFPSAVPLKPNKFYRIGLQPQNANNCDLRQFSVGNNLYLDSFFGGRDWYLTTRTNAGAWTDTTTSKPYIGLLLEKLNADSSDWIPV